MPIDASIPLGIRPQPFNNPFEQLAQIRDQQQRRQLIDQQIRSGQAQEETRRQDIAKQARTEAAQETFFNIVRTSKTPDEIEARIKIEAPEMLAPYQKQKIELDDKKASIDKTNAEIRKLRQQAAKDGLDYAAPYMQLVEKAKYDPPTFQAALGIIKSQFEDFPADQLWQQSGGTQAGIKAIVDSHKSIAQQNADTTAMTAAAELPGRQADSQVKQQVAAGTVGGLTPDQQRQQAQADRQAGFERQRISIEAGKAAQAAGDKTDLTPEGLDAAATMFAKTGQLPALGMGDKTTRKSIINRAAAMVPGLDVASAKADFGANQKSLESMQKGRDAISAFENTAGKNIDIFLDTAGKVVDTGVPVINMPVRAVTGRMLGSPDQAAYEAARQVAINEVAKITSNPNLTGQLSDSARKEIEAFNPNGATLKQTVAVMRLLKRDMANRAGSMDDQIKAIRDRIGKATDDKPKGMMRARDPQGKLHEAPAGTALPAGWTLEP